MFSVNLGSIPDITDNQVQVITVSQNLSTEDIEQFVTYPVELAMANLPGVKEIRSISDRKSTRLNSSHVAISYAVFCVIKKYPITRLEKCPENLPCHISATSAV